MTGKIVTDLLFAPRNPLRPRRYLAACEFAARLHGSFTQDVPVERTVIGLCEAIGIFQEGAAYIARRKAGSPEQLVRAFDTAGYREAESALRIIRPTISKVDAKAYLVAMRAVLDDIGPIFRSLGWNNSPPGPRLKPEMMSDDDLDFELSAADENYSLADYDVTEIWRTGVPENPKMFKPRRFNAGERRALSLFEMLALKWLRWNDIEPEVWSRKTTGAAKALYYSNPANAERQHIGRGNHAKQRIGA